MLRSVGLFSEDFGGVDEDVGLAGAPGVGAEAGLVGAAGGENHQEVKQNDGGESS